LIRSSSEPRTLGVIITGEHAMLRREPSQDPATISDRELGVAAMLLLLVVVLTALVVPGIV
jgi:hypothetical protein